MILRENDALVVTLNGSCRSTTSLGMTMPAPRLGERVLRNLQLIGNDLAQLTAFPRIAGKSVRLKPQLESDDSF